MLFRSWFDDIAVFGVTPGFVERKRGGAHPPDRRFERGGDRSGVSNIAADVIRRIDAGEDDVDFLIQEAEPCERAAVGRAMVAGVSGRSADGRGRVDAHEVKALQLLLPALFGAVFMQFALKKLKLAAIVLLISILLVLGVKYKLYPAFVSTLGAVFVSIAVGVFLHRKGLLE